MRISCIIILYSMVGRSIANIAIQPEAPCIYGGAKCRGKYATKVRYRGYGLTYHTIIYDISYGECATDEPFCVRLLNILEIMPFFTWRLVCHIPNLVTICNFQWLHNHHSIYYILPSCPLPMYIVSSDLFTLYDKIAVLYSSCYIVYKWDSYTVAINFQITYISLE